jgi:hypothetical protein
MFPFICLSLHMFDYLHLRVSNALIPVCCTCCRPTKACKLKPTQSSQAGHCRI